MNEPVIFNNSDKERINFALGSSFIIHEWRGSGPDYMHVHYADDEAWHVIEGTLTFKFQNRTYEAYKGTTVFVPAGDTAYIFGERISTLSDNSDRTTK